MVPYKKALTAPTSIYSTTTATKKELCYFGLRETTLVEVVLGLLRIGLVKNGENSLRRTVQVATPNGGARRSRFSADITQA
jgi:hypothetical protein